MIHRVIFKRKKEPNNTIPLYSDFADLKFFQIWGQHTIAERALEFIIYD